jgi:hypothetical protein
MSLTTGATVMDPKRPYTYNMSACNPLNPATV